MRAKIVLREAVRADVAAIVRLLAGDKLGGDPEIVSDPPPAAYYAAFDKIAAEPRNLLMVAQNADGAVVGTMQLTFIPGLSNRGAERAIVEAVRVDAALRNQGHGQAMLQWATDEARRRGARTLELTSNRTREAAHRFYERLGFAKSHVGMKKKL